MALPQLSQLAEPVEPLPLAWPAGFSSCRSLLPRGGGGVESSWVGTCQPARDDPPPERGRAETEVRYSAPDRTSCAQYAVVFARR